MTQLSNMPVDNGERVQVDSAMYTGAAGMRRAGEGGDFAFFSAAPVSRRSRFSADPVAALAAGLLQDRSATIDGRAAEILSIRKSDVATGMLIAHFEFVEAE